MKHMLFFLGLGLLLSQGDISAQSSIKAYANSYYLNTQISPSGAKLGKQNFDFFWPVIGYATEKPRGRVNEWQLGFWNYQATTDTTQLSANQVSLRFQRDRKLWTSADEKFNVQVGLAYQLAGSISTISPTISRNFEEKSKAFLLDVKLFTGLEYYFTDQLFLDLSTSLLGGTLGLATKNIENPNVPKRYNRFGGFDFDLFNNRVLRIGLGYRLKGSAAAITPIIDWDAV